MGSNLKFIEVIQAGDLTRFKSLLDDHPILQTDRDEQGVSAILWAVYYGHKEILDTLLGYSPQLDIWVATAVGNLERVNELLDQDASLLNAFSTDGFTALGLAAFFGNKAVLEVLLTRGADVNIAANNPMKVQALHSAFAHQDIIKAIQMAEML